MRPRWGLMDPLIGRWWCGGWRRDKAVLYTQVQPSRWGVFRRYWWHHCIFVFFLIPFWQKCMGLPPRSHLSIWIMIHDIILIKLVDLSRVHPAFLPMPVGIGSSRPPEPWNTFWKWMHTPHCWTCHQWPPHTQLNFVLKKVGGPSLSLKLTLNEQVIYVTGWF